jgi:hypothetical protein
MHSNQRYRETEVETQGNSDQKFKSKLHVELSSEIEGTK